MIQKIQVIRKEPGRLPELITIANTLPVLQGQVGGYIETVSVQPSDESEPAVVICDEEGLVNGKPLNCVLFGSIYRGTVLIAGVDGEDFTDVPDWAKDEIQADWLVAKL